MRGRSCRVAPTRIRPFRFLRATPTIFTMSNSAVFFIPAARFRARVLLSLSPRLRRSVGGYVCHSPCRCEPAPNRGAGGAPGGGILNCRALRKGAHHVCETRPSGANRNGPLGAPTLAVLGSLRAAAPQLPAAPSRGRPSLPGVAPGRPKVPNLPGRGYGPRRGTPILAPPSGSSPDDAPRERGWAKCSRTPK
jgi:hypothetical protein